GSATPDGSTVSGPGRLIQTSAGGRATRGGPLTNRSGWAANAASSAFWRTSHTASTWSWCTVAGVSIAIPLWWCSWLYQRKNSRKYSRASAIEEKRPGKYGLYFVVLNWASENALS